MPEYNYFELPTENRTKLSLLELPVEGQAPKAVVQIIHGALEYKERYLPLAEYLRDHGFAVVLSDNRGHGHSTSEDNPFGLMPGVDRLIADQVMISDWIKSRYPDTPLDLFGHSMGSMLARIYLQRHDARVHKLVMTGTVYYNRLAPLGLKIISAVHLFKQDHEFSDLVSKVCGNSINGYDWLSFNKENIREVRADKRMVKRYPIGSMRTMIKANERLRDVDDFTCANPNLPILNLVGDHDRIAGGRRGIASTVNLLLKAGYHDVTTRVMPHMKHELLMEKERQKVFKLILDFLED